MTKVTITSQPEGNEPTEIPARAEALLIKARTVPTDTLDRERFETVAVGLIDALLKIEDLSAEQCALLDQALSMLCKEHGTADARHLWARMAKDLHKAHERFRLAYSDWRDEGSIEADESPAGVAYRAAVAASQEGAGLLAKYRAQIAVEQYARFLAVDGIYAEYACNPPALAELARRVTNMQKASRQYADDFAPVLKALAVQKGFFDKGGRTDPDESPPSPATAPTSGLISSGHAVSLKVPDADTPFGKAVALRNQLRAEVRAYEDAHDTAGPAELEERVTEAEHAMYLAPAVSLEEVIWKFGENLMEGEGCYSHAEAVATLENEHGLEAAAAVGVYRDLEHLAGIDNGAHGRSAVRHRWDRARLLAAE